jgi:uncharacterized CHY-type Zn-finger protein
VNEVFFSCSACRRSFRKHPNLKVGKSKIDSMGNYSYLCNECRKGYAEVKKLQKQQHLQKVKERQKRKRRERRQPLPTAHPTHPVAPAQTVDSGAEQSP